jgi:TolB-like protein/Tfp pilus assembly protein PilF
VRGDDLALATLAESVADGTPVDWQSADADSPRVRRLVRHLRLVDSIAALHRSMPADEAAVPVPAPEPRAPRGKRWGRLVLLEQIGTGTSCDVFRAWDAELHRDVALKLLHDEPGPALRRDDSDHDPRTRMLHEARRMARLRHEHVVQVYGAEEHDGRVGLWMELVRGTSLEELVQERGALGSSEAALIGLDICAALAAVHGAGLLHRDVKAQNVMREDGGRIVLMDFGTGEDLAGTNRLVGTPLYLAPEIFQGQRASVQSDVYAVGVLLYYLVTGKFPVTAASMDHLARAHQQRQRRALRDQRPDAPQAFVGVVERALESDPARRYRSVGELESALREALVPQARGRTEEKRDLAAAAGPVLGTARSLSTQTVLIGVALIVLVIAAAFMTWSRSRAGAPAVPRIAVLPFKPEVAGGNAPYLADRLTDQLIQTLGQIRSLRVTSLASVLPFKDGATPPSEIAQRLHVDNVLQATLHVMTTAEGRPDRVRVNARLIAAGGGPAVWSHEFERSLGDVRALNAEIAKGIVDSLGVALTEEERRRLEVNSPTLPPANDAYFLGMHLLSQSSADATGAVEAFRRAIDLDPRHAGAHAGLARGLMTLGFTGALQHPAARATAAVEVRTALVIDPESSEAHAVAADLQFFYDWDWASADRSYRRAIDLNPSFARAHSQYSRFLAAAGRSRESLIEASIAAELEPMSASAISTRAVAEYFGRDFLTALQSAEHAVQLEPLSPSHHIVRARVLAAAGDLQAALQSSEHALTLGRASTVTSWRAFHLWLQALNGQQANARAGLERLMADVQAARQSLSATHLAYVYAALGDRDQAMTLLERAVSDRDPEALWLAFDPRVEGLRGDPRFQQVLQGLAIPR